MTQDPEDEGAWIFLSHSHKDWEKVRRIRNLLEEKGHKPLLFFLKCLNDESEIDDLIRREIESRTWFLLCDSPNARSSRWVNAEIKIIKELEGKVHEVVNLDDDIERQAERVAALCRRATIFVSYSRRDATLADRIKRYLRENDYRVWDFDDQTMHGGDWAYQIRAGIDKAAEKGFFLVLLSPHAFQSAWLAAEVNYAFETASTSGRGANVVPVVIADPQDTFASMPATLQFQLANIQWFDIFHGDFDTNMKTLIQALKTREME